MSFEDPDNALRRRGTDPLIEVLTHDMRRMREDMNALTTGVAKMTEALTKLVIVEERQANLSAAQERCFGEVAKLQKRADEDADKNATRIESAILKLNGSIERLHDRIDKQSAEIQNDLDDLATRLGVVEQSLPETNRLKEWAFEAIKWLAVAGVMSYAVKAGVLSS